LDVVLQKKLEKRVVIVIQQDRLKIRLLLHFYEFVKILLGFLILLEGDLVGNESTYTLRTFGRCAYSGRSGVPCVTRVNSRPAGSVCWLSRICDQE
jgi:hypothetical protein